MTDHTISNSAILYQGKSELDGAPIAAVITGLDKPSSNSKTGDMLQVFFIRTDINPYDAQKSGLDVSVCGSCVMRPANEVQRIKLGIAHECYVITFHSVRAVYDALCRGHYQHVDDMDTDDLIDRVNGRRVRLGAYGDPMAIPYDVLVDSLKKLGYPITTGYTHQWKRPNAKRYNKLLQASCDTVADKAKAHSLGFNTATISDPDAIPCPAQKTRGKVTCGTCTGPDKQPLCSGSTADISFVNH